MSGPTPPPKSGMMSLYANLLDPSLDSPAAAASISRAPVVFKQGDSDNKDDASKKPLDPGATYSIA